MATSSILAKSTINSTSPPTTPSRSSTSTTSVSTLTTRKRSYETAIDMPSTATGTSDQRTTSPTLGQNGKSKSKSGLVESVIVINENASAFTASATTLRDSTRTISQSDIDDGGEAAAAEDLLPTNTNKSTATCTEDYLSGGKRKYVPHTEPALATGPSTSQPQQFYNGSGASDFAVSLKECFLHL